LGGISELGSLGHLHTHFIMSIEGIYKVNIEQTVRKIGEAEHDSIQRILRKWTGNKVDDIPPDPNKEAKIQKMIAEYQEDELATTMRLEIAPDRASIRSTDGDADYRIKSRSSDGDSRVSLILELPPEEDGEEPEEMRWDITVIRDHFLVFGGPEEDDMSGFVWERV
jgi:hypothetical protein